jgi:hypothetical protein
MKKMMFTVVCFSAAIWLNSCTNCPPTTITVYCDSTITSWKHFLNKDTAQVYINRFKDFKEGKVPFNTNMIVQSHLYNEAKTMMRNMMLRDSCVGIRIYYGLNWSNKIIPITCGVKNDGSDIYWRRSRLRPSNPTARTGPGYEDGLLDTSQEEPPIPDGIISLERIMIR